MPGMYYHIMTGRGDPVGEKGSHKEAKELETVLAPLLESHRNTKIFSHKYMERILNHKIK